LYKLSRT